MTVGRFTFIAAASYVLMRMGRAICAAPLFWFSIAVGVLGLMWLDGSPWFVVVSSFAGIIMIFAVVLGIGLILCGAPIAALVLIFVALCVSGLIDFVGGKGSVADFNTTHQNEMMVHDPEQGWKVVNLPPNRGYHLIQVSDWEWILADPEVFNEDYSRPDKHPTKLVETAPGKWEFVNREDAYSQRVMDRYNRPIIGWFAKVRSNVPVTDISRPTINPYYVAEQAKSAAHTKAEAVTKSSSHGSYHWLIVGSLLLIGFITRLLIKPQTT